MSRSERITTDMVLAFLLMLMVAVSLVAAFTRDSASGELTAHRCETMIRRYGGETALHVFPECVAILRSETNHD